MNRKVISLILAFAIVVSTGCASSYRHQLERLPLGSSASLVERELGKPQQVTPSQHNERTEVWRYSFTDESPARKTYKIALTILTFGGAALFFNEKRMSYGLSFEDDQLMKKEHTECIRHGFGDFNNQCW